MKSKIIILFLSLITFNTFGQNVEINLFKECLSENNFKIIKGKVPYLVIRIKNTTGKDIYFKNPFLSVKNELPEFGSSMIHSTYIESNQVIKRDLANSKRGETFFVKIGNSTNFYDAFEVQNEKIFKTKDTIYEIPYINDELSFIYKSIRLQKILNRKGIKKKLSLFTDKDNDLIPLNEVKKELSFTEFQGANKELILVKENKFDIKLNKDIFCFLKKGESIDFRINLIGFRFLGGSYYLSLAFDKFDNYIEYRNKKIILPSNYNNYYLYQGEIKFNDLKISF